MASLGRAEAGHGWRHGLIDLNNRSNELRRQDNEGSRDQGRTGSPRPQTDSDHGHGCQGHSHEHVAKDHLPRAGKSVAQVKGSATTGGGSGTGVVVPGREESTRRNQRQNDDQCAGTGTE
jgi:hypothetical protein